MIELQRKLASELALITQDKSEEDILALPLDLRMDVMQAMTKLNENEKLSIMAEMAGYSDQEVATEKGVSINVVQQWRTRARKKMREFAK
jgi:DNA-directed RNA polymerase specialized sigma24 family protein